jgi:hypothetical protein
MTINEIWEQVKVLSPKERDELVRRLLSLPTDTPAARQMHDILEFQGIAAHFADDEDPQAYVNRIRDEWDTRS